MNNTPSFRMWLMMLCGTMLYFFVLFLRSAIPAPIFDLLQNELGDKAAVATLGAMFMYSYGVTQLVAGLLVDRYGGRQILFWGGLLMLIGAFMFPLAPSLPYYYIARLLSGVGAGTIYLCLVKEAMSFPRQWYGMLVGSIVTIGFIGGIMANSPFVYAVSKFNNDFNSVLLYLAYVMCFFFLCWVGIAISTKSQPVNRNISLNLSAYFTVIKKWNNWKVFLFNSINFSLFCVFQTVIGHKFLSDVLRVKPTLAALVFTLTATITAISGLLLPVLSRLTGDRRSILCSKISYINLISFGIFLLMMVLNIRLPILAIFIFLILSFTMNSMVIVVPMLRSINADETTGVAVGILNFMNFIFVAILGQLAGLLLKTFSRGGSSSAYMFFFGITTILAIVELYCAKRLSNDY